MSSDRTLSTERLLPFAQDAIYAAFATPELLAAWWGPEGFTNSFDVFDFRAGGQWLFTMHGPDGKHYVNKSFFSSIDPTGSIVIRHDCQPYFTLTVRFVPVATGTLLTWDQAFDDAETARAVQAVVGTANEQNLDRLTRVLAASTGAA